ncbi:MAG: Spy/CpxP family protein refolding chaperone [Pyrinomonadaceae bacterium]
MQKVDSMKMFSGLVLTGAVALTGIVGLARHASNQDSSGAQNVEPQARRRGGMNGPGGGPFAVPFARNLNLTDAQKEQMRQIADRYRESFSAARQQEGPGGPRGGDLELLKDGAFDEAAVRTAAQARATARVEAEVTQARMMHEMYNVLTAEQKAQVAAERQQWEQRRQQRSGNDNPVQNQ